MTQGMPVGMWLGDAAMAAHGTRLQCFTDLVLRLKRVEIESPIFCQML